MKRVITSLTLLLLLCGAYAQSISKYEYWTDDDYASRSVVNSSGGEISLSIATDKLSAGIHFLNFRAGRSDGVWGNLYRYLYYIPTLKSVDTGELTMEYWLDDNLAGKKSETAGDNNLSLAIDISSLTPGVHYFNCTPISASGERGSSERHLFYVPQVMGQTEAPTLKSYEYWLDDDYENRVSASDNQLQQAFAINVSQLAGGIHYFNYRAADNRGTWSQPIRKIFYLARADKQATKEKYKYEYWIDNDADHKVTGEGMGPEFAFDIDVSGLSESEHSFNFRAMDVLDRWGETYIEKFNLNKSLGDANGDGKVNIVDIVEMINAKNGKPSAIFNLQNADMDGNNEINQADIDAVVNIIMSQE